MNVVVVVFSFLMPYIESKGVVWRKAGEAITIQCSTSDVAVEYLHLYKGLSEELQVVFKDRQSESPNIAFRDRLQTNAAFPDVDIFIRNLTSTDTGPYWCMYKKFDGVLGKLIKTKGRGSVLLVVAGEPQQFIYFATNVKLQQFLYTSHNL